MAQFRSLPKGYGRSSFALRVNMLKVFLEAECGRQWATMRPLVIHFMTFAWDEHGPVLDSLPDRFLADFSVNDNEFSDCMHMEIDMKNSQTINGTRVGMCAWGETFYRGCRDNSVMAIADFADWSEMVGATYTSTQQRCVS
jgi:hypothetical protein